jgi:hypothetical protein
MHKLLLGAFTASVFALCAPAYAQEDMGNYVLTLPPAEQRAFFTIALGLEGNACDVDQVAFRKEHQGELWFLTTCQGGGAWIVTAPRDPQANFRYVDCDKVAASGLSCWSGW